MSLQPVGVGRAEKQRAGGRADRRADRSADSGPHPGADGDADADADACADQCNANAFAYDGLTLAKNQCGNIAYIIVINKQNFSLTQLILGCIKIEFAEGRLTFELSSILELCTPHIFRTIFLKDII